MTDAPMTLLADGRVTRPAVEGELLYRHLVRHWEIVNDDHGGSMFGVSSVQEWDERKAREQALYWLRPGYHLEVKEQVWWSTEADWTTVESEKPSITVVGD